jgi:hypothetical protein
VRNGSVAEMLRAVRGLLGAVRVGEPFVWNRTLRPLGIRTVENLSDARFRGCTFQSRDRLLSANCATVIRIIYTGLRL